MNNAQSLNSNSVSPSGPTFDYIVIGAGTAGCLLANRLSADPSKRVLLIEAGGRDDYHWIHIPVGYLHCIGNPRTDWLYKTEAEAGLNGRSLRYPRGKVLGGCSSINGMIYMRGQVRDYDEWARLSGDDAWSWARVLPDFIKHEEHYRLDSAKQGADAVDAADVSAFVALHGHSRLGSSGEWRVEKQRLHWPILDAFIDAAQQAGIKPTDDFNGGNNEGVGYFEVNQKRGVRWNGAKAFLRPTCYGRPNFEMWTGAQVVRLITKRGGADGLGALQCLGVEVMKEGGGLTSAFASNEVALCAGAIGSPQILQLSGIGPRPLLSELGIPIVHELKGVGENLQDHLQIRSVYTLHGPHAKGASLNSISSTWFGKAKIALQYALTQSGPMSMAPSQLGCFTKTDASMAYPNIEFHVQPLSLDSFGEPLHSFDAFTASVCNLNPTSRGRVQIKSNNFLDAPSIAPNYLSTDEDRKVAAESLRIARRICTQPALLKYQPKEWKPGLQFQSDEDLAKLAGDIATTIFHPVGTTKMGREDDEMAVVDSKLRVRGVAGLRVIDAGVMPLITSGNTNSPTLMIAEKAATWMIADAAKSQV